MKNIKLLQNRIDEIKKMGWIKCDYKNYGAVGLKIEKLLNINSENFEIPDYNGIEIKTKKSIFRKNINLFSAAPDSFLFEIKRLHQLYSYPDKENREHKILNKTIFQNKLTYVYNNIYFSLKVNKEEEKIKLIIFNSNLEIIDDYTFWSFDMLREKLERKLKYLCYIQVETNYWQHQLYIKIKEEHYYKLIDFNAFIKLIENGKISITFKIGTFKSGKRKGQIHDHGTSFGIDEKDIELLFEKIL